MPCRTETDPAAKCSEKPGTGSDVSGTAAHFVRSLLLVDRHEHPQELTVGSNINHNYGTVNYTGFRSEPITVTGPVRSS